MHYRLLTNLMIIASLFLFYGCGSDDDNGTDVDDTVITRVIAKLHSDPGFGSVDSDVWDSITHTNIYVGADRSNNYNANVSFTDHLTTEMKALVTTSHIYFRFRWPDNDNDNLFQQWHAYLYNDINHWEAVDTAHANEDRFYIMFNNDGTSSKAGADCSAFCHSGTPSNAGREFYAADNIDPSDMWHWKANRTGLANLAEDMRLTDTTVVADSNLSALYYRNVGVYGLMPKYMHQDDTAFTGPGLLESETVAGLFDSLDNDLEWVSIVNAGMDTVGKYIPGYYIMDLSGKRGSTWDVEAISEHDGTHWTVVFRRDLTTNDSRDVDFDFSQTDSIAISIAFGDNSGMEHHGVEPFYLVFSKD